MGPKLAEKYKYKETPLLALKKRKSKILYNKVVELPKFQDFTKCQEVPKDQVMTYHSENMISKGKCV